VLLRVESAQPCKSFAELLGFGIVQLFEPEVQHLVHSVEHVAGVHIQRSHVVVVLDFVQSIEFFVRFV